MKRRNQKRFVEPVEKLVKELGLPLLSTEHDIDDYLASIDGILNKATREQIPTVSRDPVVRTRQRLADRLTNQVRGAKPRNPVPSVFGLAKACEVRAQAKQLAHIPTLKLGGEEFTTDKDKALCLGEAVWPSVSYGETAPPTTCPPLPLDRVQYPADDGISPDELIELMRRLPERKAVGPDQVANEALIIDRDVLAVSPSYETLQQCRERLMALQYK